MINITSKCIWEKRFAYCNFLPHWLKGAILSGGLRGVLILVCIFLIVAGCSIAEDPEDLSISTILEWKSRQYVLTNTAITDSEIDQLIGLVDSRNVKVVNCRECPPPLISQGNKLFKIKNIKEKEAIAVAIQESQYYRMDVKVK